jgi:2-polyprenyl-3-methyl-5-hydroxy-6-metoxy-1,4-benzoquinol methylase
MLIGSLPAQETFRFLHKWLPPPPLRVLEVGCGSGFVAAMLASEGYSVEAIDSDLKVRSDATDTGVCFRSATWPDFTPSHPTAIIFVRTLHHIADIDTGIAHCVKTLPSDGIVLVEDFAFSDMPDSANRWFQGWVVRAERNRLLSPTVNAFVERILGKIPASHEHAPALSAAEVDSALTRFFSCRFRDSVPYFYRYLIESLIESPAALQFGHDLFNEEQAQIASGELWPLGRRWVCAMK